MKTLITVTIEGPAHNDLDQAKRSIITACSAVKERTSNGSRIRISSINPDEREQLYSMIGRIVLWSMGSHVELKDWLKGRIEIPSV